MAMRVSHSKARARSDRRTSRPLLRTALPGVNASQAPRRPQAAAQDRRFLLSRAHGHRPGRPRRRRSQAEDLGLRRPRRRHRLPVPGAGRGRPDRGPLLGQGPARPGLPGPDRRRPRLLPAPPATGVLRRAGVRRRDRGAAVDHGLRAGGRLARRCRQRRRRPAGPAHDPALASVATMTPWPARPGFAIGLRPIAPADWLEGGEADPARRKDALLAAHPALVWGEAPGSRPAQAEALALVAQALEEPIEAGDAPPLYAAARRIPDDLLMEKTAGVWRATAMSLSAPTFFTVAGVLGRDLAELHGPMPGFAAQLLTRVERIFFGLRDDLVLERRNWTVVNSAEPFVPDASPI